MTVFYQGRFNLRNIARHSHKYTLKTRQQQMARENCIHWANGRLDWIERVTMPGRRNRPGSRQGNWEMINRPLDADELKAFDKWAKENLGDIEELCAHVMLAGYKIGISYHEDSGSFISTLSGKDEDGCLNPRRSMSSWSGEMDDAIMMSLYKHVVVFDNGIWEAVEQAQRRG